MKKYHSQSWMPGVGGKAYGRVAYLKNSPGLFVAIVKSGMSYLRMPPDAKPAFDIAEVREGDEVEIIKSPQGFYITQTFRIAK